MFAHRFFPGRLFAPRYFPPVSAGGAVDVAGYIAMLAPHKRPPQIDDEEALIAWFFLEEME